MSWRCSSPSFYDNMFRRLILNPSIYISILHKPSWYIHHHWLLGCLFSSWSNRVRIGFNVLNQYWINIACPETQDQNWDVASRHITCINLVHNAVLDISQKRPPNICGSGIYQYLSSLEQTITIEIKCPKIQEILCRA